MVNKSDTAEFLSQKFKKKYNLGHDFKEKSKSLLGKQIAKVFLKIREDDDIYESEHWE